MRSILLRRWGGLWLAAAIVLGAWLAEGAGVLVAALAAACVIVVAEHMLRRSRPGVARRSLIDLASAPVAGVSWMLAAAIALTAPVVRVLRAHRGSGLGHWTFAQAHLASPWSTANDLLVTGALVSSLLLARALRRPERLVGESSQAAMDRARAIVAEHGEDSLSPYILRPDKQFLFHGEAVVAFTVTADTVVVSADPVGPAPDAAAALGALIERAHRAGLAVAAYGASGRHLQTYRNLGLRVIQTGEEAVVDPATFTLEGRRARKLRQSVRRVERSGWHIVLREGRDVDAQTEVEIAVVEQRWRAERRRILGSAMSMGEFEPAIRPDDLYLLARSPDGDIRGVVRFLHHCENLSLDIVRRVGETPNGLTEAMISLGLERARAEGIGAVSLNYAGLAHLLRDDACARRRGHRILRMLVRRLHGRFQMERLVLFNEKFDPAWNPRYLVVDSAVGLPRAIIRVLQVEGYLARREPLRGAAPGRWGLGASPTLESGLRR